MEVLKVVLESVCPLLMHNGRMANPIDPYSKKLKEVTSKRTKTDKDYEVLSCIEWEAGLYTDEEGYPCLPAEVIMGAVSGGAKKSRLGKVFASAVFVEKDARLQNTGSSKKAKELLGNPKYTDSRIVRVGTVRIVRTRPIFPTWKAEVEFIYNEALVNKDQLIQAIEDAGQQVGVGDYRPKYGRFNMVS